MPEKPKKECRHKDGPDGYHRIPINGDHRAKAEFEAMWSVYLSECGDNCSAMNQLLKDNRAGYRARKQAEAAERVKTAFPGAEVIE